MSDKKTMNLQCNCVEYSGRDRPPDFVSRVPRSTSGRSEIAFRISAIDMAKFLQPANGTDTDEAERRLAIDEILDEVLREKPSKISAAKLLEESRR